MFATLLLLIVLTIAANIHPEGPTVVILMLFASPFFIIDVRAMFAKNKVPLPQIFGLLFMLPGFWLLGLLCQF